MCQFLIEFLKWFIPQRYEILVEQPQILEWVASSRKDVLVIPSLSKHVKNGDVIFLSNYANATHIRCLVTNVTKHTGFSLIYREYGTLVIPRDPIRHFMGRTVVNEYDAEDYFLNILPDACTDEAVAITVAVY